MRDDTPVEEPKDRGEATIEAETIPVSGVGELQTDFQPDLNSDEPIVSDTPKEFVPLDRHGNPLTGAARLNAEVKAGLRPPPNRRNKKREISPLMRTVMRSRTTDPEISRAARSFVVGTIRDLGGRKELSHLQIALLGVQKALFEVILMIERDLDKREIVLDNYGEPVKGIKTLHSLANSFRQGQVALGLEKGSVRKKKKTSWEAATEKYKK